MPEVYDFTMALTESRVEMNFIKTIFGTADTPRPARKLYRLLKVLPTLLREYILDMINFLRYSCTLGEYSAQNLRGRITESFHNIEKGLSLSEPRPGFGAERVEILLKLCNRYIDKFGKVERVLYSARDTLREYKKYNESCGLLDYPHREDVEVFISKIDGNINGKRGGTRLLKKEEVIAVTSSVTPEFFFQRHSIRQFSSQNVDLSDINVAIAIALKSPAVCNRQYARSLVLADPDLIARILEIQGGARGFSGGINKLIVVTTTLSHFWNAGERNQPWIDGGMYAMSLVLGLHSRGLGTCCLNWSRVNSKTAEMKQILKIPHDEFIIMMIGVGHLPEEFKVAYSDRVSVNEASRIIGQDKVLNS